MSDDTVPANTTTTITEALAELHVIDKRLQKKREFIGMNALRNEREKDPFEDDGGSAEVVRREMQAISDLENRKVAIRRAIRQTNEQTIVTVASQQRSVADWLNWRKEVAPGRLQFLNGVRQGINGHRANARKAGQNVTTPDQAQKGDIMVHLDELVLAHQIEDIEAALETLDGQLSLKNATVTVSY